MPACINKLKAQATALALGVQDGWQQPHHVDWSTNLDHLADSCDQHHLHEIQDFGINLGQFARAQFRSEAWTQAMPPFHFINRHGGK